MTTGDPMKPRLTPERVNALAIQAYRATGYAVIRFEDGSRGVVHCPSRVVRLMNAFQSLLCDALEEKA
jgi:hypothetical protein